MTKMIDIELGGRTVRVSEEQLSALVDGKRPSATRHGLPLSPLFDNLDDAMLAEIARLGRRRQYAAGSTIHNKNEAADTLTLVIDGKIRSMIRNERGKEKATSTPVASAGEIVDYSPLTRSKMFASAEAVTATSVLEISRADFESLMLSSAQFALNVARVVTESSLAAQERNAELSGATSYRKLVMTLLFMAETDGTKMPGGWIRINTPMTQAELGGMIGAAREMVNGAFKKLYEMGIAGRDGRHITVKMEALRKEEKESA